MATFSLNTCDWNTLLPVIENFPEPGISFRDISALLKHPYALAAVIQEFKTRLALVHVDHIVGIDSRGFIFGSLLAQAMELPFVMARKPGKLPGEVTTISYTMEYGNQTTHDMQIKTSSLSPGSQVAVVDDILATGGTFLAAAKLIERLNGKLAAFCCVAEILDTKFNGGANLTKMYPNVPQVTLTTCTSHEVHFMNRTPLWTNINPMIQDHDTKLQEAERKTKQDATPLASKDATPFVLLYHPEMKLLAERLVSFHPHLFDLRHAQWKHFHDGWPNLSFDTDLANRRVVFLGSLLHKHHLVEQQSLTMVLPRQSIQSLDVYYPYYSVGTMESIQPGVVATGDTVAQMMSSCFPVTKEGPVICSTFDVHHSTIRGFFNNNMPMNPLTALPLLFTELENLCGSYLKFALAFPDDGSKKRFKSVIEDLYPHQEFTMIVCGKIRKGDERKVRLVDHPDELNFSSLDHVVIVDDIAHTGGTIYECYKALTEAGCHRVSAFLPHAVFERDEHKNFLPDGKFDGLFRFWITDSIPEQAAKLHGHDPFRVLSLTSCIVKDLIRRRNPQFMTPKLSVFVSSEQPIKLQAVKNAFQSIYCSPSWCVDIHGISTDSKVEEQPVDLVNIADGAQNRHSALMEKVSDQMLQCWIKNQSRSIIHMKMVFVSLESGIIDFDGSPLLESKYPVVDDIARAIISYGDHHCYTWTKSVRVSRGVWQRWRKEHQNDPTLTIGKLYCQYNPSITAHDWQGVDEGETRLYLMYNTLKDMLCNSYL